jgi:hypothetical protein
MDVTEIGYTVVVWIQLAHDRVQRYAVTNTVMYFLIRNISEGLSGSKGGLDCTELVEWLLRLY